MEASKVIDFYGNCVEENLDKFLSEIVSIASITEEEDEEGRQRKIMEDMMEVYYNISKNHEEWKLYEAYFSDELTEYLLVTIKNYCEGFPKVQESCNTIIEDGY